MTTNRCTKVLRARLDYINAHPHPTDGMRGEAAALRWALNRLADEAQKELTLCRQRESLTLQ